MQEEKKQEKKKDKSQRLPYTDIFQKVDDNTLTVGMMTPVEDMRKF